MRPFAVGLAVFASIPVLSVAVLVASATLSELLDPCFLWNDAGPRAVSPDGPCASGGSTVLSKAQVVLITLYISGGLIAASALAIFGAARKRPALCYVSPFVAAASSFLLLVGIAGVLLVPSMVLFVVTGLISSPRPPKPHRPPYPPYTVPPTGA